MNPFRSKIKCFHCGKNFRRKIEREKGKFICGGYNNKNGCTKRIVISEEDIRYLINKRYDRELLDEEIVEILDYILIESELIMEIHFLDGGRPILLKEKFLQF